MDISVTNRQRGQIALIVLLVLTIATTVGLSLAARTTTDVALSSKLEESSRAFSAAEAGIEQTLKSGVASANPNLDQLGTKYAVTVGTVAGSNAVYVLPKKTPSEETDTIWLTNHNADGSIDDTVPTYTGASIDLCWSAETTTPAVEVTVLYKETTDNSYRVVKGAYDSDGTRRAANFFSAPTATSGGCGVGTSTTYKQTINFSALAASLNPAADVLIALRVRPIYSQTQLAVSPTGILPQQGLRVESVGTTASGLTRKIVVYQQYRQPGTIFDAAVWSQGSFSQ